MTDPAVPPAAPTPAPAAAGTKQTMSLVGFILGLVGLVFSWALIFGLLVSVAAIIVSVLARKREPAAPQWMKIVGLIAGIVGGVIALLVLVFWILALATFATACSGLSAYGC